MSADCGRAGPHTPDPSGCCQPQLSYAHTPPLRVNSATQDDVDSRAVRMREPHEAEGLRPYAPAGAARRSRTGRGGKPARDDAGEVGSPAGCDDAVVREIEAEFSGWGVWRSDTGRWWAFRTAADPLTIDQLRAGCRLGVQADTPDDLRRAIRGEIEAARRVLDEQRASGS